MSSNLQNTFKSAQKSTQVCFGTCPISPYTRSDKTRQSALDERAKELIDDEAEISDQRVRFDVERRIAFFEELEDTQVRSRLHRIFHGRNRNTDVIPSGKFSFHMRCLGLCEHSCETGKTVISWSPRRYESALKALAQLSVVWTNHLC